MDLCWKIQCKIAHLVIQVDADSTACQQDMWKFLCLYEAVVVDERQLDLRFHISQQDGLYSFVYIAKDGSHQHLWQSTDEREISAALEIHFYSNIVQYLYPETVSIHAAVLNIQEQAVMFAGLSGAGKSSVCTAGLLAGAAYLSDEFTLLAEDGMVFPFPRPMQWEYAEHPAFDRQHIQQTGLIAADYFDFPDSQGEVARCHIWHPQHIQRKPLPLTHIVLHQYDGSAKAAELIAIPRHEALVELPQHLHVQQGMAMDLPMLNQRIDKDCRFYRLPFSDVFAAWKLIESEATQKQ
ncbi:MAG: hypothetical protein R8M45_04585 [Ghiorsea sp.]